MKNQLTKQITLLFLSLLLLTACQPALLKTSPQDTATGYASSSDGASIFYSQTPTRNKPTLVFIHCLGCNSHYWDAQIKHLSKTYQTITIDLAGHGRSDSYRKNFTIPNFADDVTTVINKLELSNVILIGQSLGAAIAIETALKLPNPITSIITVDTFEKNNQWPKKVAIESTMQPFKKNFYQATYPYIKNKFAPYTDKALIYQISKDIALTPPAIGISALNNFFLWHANNYPTAKKRLQIPLLHINSLANNTKTNKTDKFILVKTLGHFIPQEAPHQFNHALDQSLSMLNNLIQN